MFRVSASRFQKGISAPISQFKFFRNTANYIFFASKFCAYSIELKNTRNCGQFGVCGTNLGADAVGKPTGPRRRRNACKRKLRRYRNPRSLNQATRV
ncbi:hypothetical protein L596_025441 [Steinernema carpocapsae]|uniref:Uncharacterized protein n=1 Tax=Steinernema carpocapsae TaxID=34508 RepID=A0A4U5M7T5_STECR|nr:hypothetical protein L596_025441 [Steinernema carpocapsae]